jgi:hypothetical protein
MRVFSCPQCAAEVEISADKLSELCAFCETPLVLDSDQDRAPVDLVAPFDLTQRVAAERLRQHLAGHWMAPEAVRNAADPDELRGVLVPFWVQDATARSEYTADVGLWWYETQTYTVTVNGKTQVRTRRVRHTEWHSCAGSHVHEYQDHLVSGSSGLPEAEANELEPFDLGKAVPFNVSYLAGQVAERPSIDHDEARRTATEELAQLENRAIKGFLPGDEVRGVRNQTQIEVQRVRLALLPVWISAYTWKGKTFRLLVNGQSGEVIGDVPRSWVKVGGIVAVVLVLFLLILGCMGAVGVVNELVQRGGVGKEPTHRSPSGSSGSGRKKKKRSRRRQ